MAYKGTETDVLMAWKWRGGLTPLLSGCSREASLFNISLKKFKNFKKIYKINFSGLYIKSFSGH
jgi:hypothetical protein